MKGKDRQSRHGCLWRRGVWLSLVLCWLCWSLPAIASPLAERLSTFPEWQGKPVLKPATGSLIYPDWFLGDWQVTSTLVDMAAPLAPQLVTPGYADNQEHLNEPVTFKVRFIEEPTPIRTKVLAGASPWELLSRKPSVIADLVFNGRSLAAAYLGDDAVKQVTIDPRFPNRQTTVLKQDRQLISTISDRNTEFNPKTDTWIASELFQQEFRSNTQIYLNQVENTTAYRYINTLPAQIDADQVTAIYLSPQDPDYFQAFNQPVALYRYHLVLTAIQVDER
ncbi:DUF6816 family protein [Acaryochloris sp. IP29b_bin.148]|uniref:DUF6816 family protein n=1 Tax=Acaryochloris sp. IP29b_bin.148 TaxID=2969218 RepID=UPI0026068664|nr:hypothetical protein [Acaryochloris sp. IP29b_bin.148]